MFLKRFISFRINRLFTVFPNQAFGSRTYFSANVMPAANLLSASIQRIDSKVFRICSRTVSWGQVVANQVLCVFRPSQGLATQLSGIIFPDLAQKEC